MALIVEDGTLVDDANSYVDVAYARAYAAARGTSLPVADADVEVLLIKAMDFIESWEHDFLGTRIDALQELSWPRQDVWINGFEQDKESLPKQLLKAQAQLAMDAMTSDLLPSSDGREVLREKIDVIETQYAQTGSSAATPTFAKAFALLDPLCGGGGGMNLTLVHV